MGKKDKLARLMYYTGTLKFAQLFNTGNLKILAYHRVVDIPSKSNYEFDIELISASTSDFEQQMRHVKKHYKPTTFEKVFNKLQNNEEIEKDSVIVTFDDGFDDNYLYAYPILKQLNIPATFFISTSYIDTTNIFWFDWVIYLVKKLPNSKLNLDGGNISFNLDQGNREHIGNLILSHMKRVPNSKRISLIKELQSACTTPVPADAKKESTAMTWKQIQEMSNNNMEIGSHTCTHPILSQLSPEELESEMADSKNIIEEKLNKECLSISYPVGGKDGFDSNVKSVCANNYRIGCSYISGSNDTSTSDLFELKRLHVERYTNIERFAAMLAAPAIFK